MNRFSKYRVRCAIALLAFGLPFCGLPSMLVGQIVSPPPKPLSAELSAPIRTLLTEDWIRTPQFEARSKATFQNAGAASDDLLVGYTINRIRHNRVKEAKRAVQDLTDKHRDNLDGWVLKAWLFTLTDDYDAALINMRNLKKRVDQTKDLPEASQRIIFKRLGRLLGYMQGPVADRVNKDLLDETVQIVADGLKPEMLKLFNENQSKVQKVYDDLTKEQTAKTQKELVKVKVSNDAEAVGLERQVKLLEQTESQLIPEKQRVRDDSAKQIASIERQGSSVESQISRINADLRTTAFDLQIMRQDLFLILQQPPRFRVSTFALENQIRNAELTLNALNSEGLQANNQLNLLQSQLVATRRSSNQRLNELEREIKKVNGAKRRNLAKLVKLAKGPKVADGKREAMRSKAIALRTYDDLSLELYRQDILDYLSN